MGRARWPCRPAHQCQAKVAEPFLGTETGKHFPLGIEVYAVVFEVLGCHFPPQAENAHGLAVAVVFWVSGGLGQLFDHQVWGGSDGFPMPRSITSLPERRFSYIRRLIWANR